MPKRIGQYHIKRVIASGGMGTVYQAIQEQPRRTVAVKLMRTGIASPSALRRFEYESQLLARLRHPGIAQVYQAGTHRDGGVTVPYFAMEYIPNAKPINQYVKEKNLGTRERLALVIQVCDAVHHGHQKGIIHRDLKPGNILVDSAGQVKVIDFGVARSTDSDMALTTLQTHVGQLIGTLQYMSPEQCEADPHDIDTRSDVYALGVVLYELLTGQLPYDLSRAAVYEATRVIREQQPTNPSTINRALRGDVETIALKALEKDRERRYQSASALTADIRCYLNNETISARPPSVAYQLRMFARRNKGLISAVATVFVVLVAGVIVSTSLYLRADFERQRAEQEAKRAVLAEQEQSRAREEAESERERAEGERQRADQARGEAEQRSQELEQVAEFQASQLSEIDTELMGVRLRTDILNRRREALAGRGADPADIEAGLQALESSLAGVNFTNVALETLDENIFERALTAIEKDLADQPLVKVRLLQTVANTLRDVGLLDQATAPQEEALRLRREHLGDDHPDTFASMNDFGKLFLAQGLVSKAEPYWKQALERRRRVLGDDHPDTLESINNMAILSTDKGQDVEAERYGREALEGRRRVLGDDDPETLESFQNMGYWLKNQGKLSEAEPYFREALQGFRRVLGNGHPDTLTSVGCMGSLLEQQGRRDEAERYYREGLEGYRRVLGDYHPHTLIAMSNLASLLYDNGDLVEAEGYWREALEGRRRVLGDDHPATLRLMNNMAYVLKSQGKLSDAEPYFREVLERSRRLLGDDHADTRRRIYNMGKLLQQQGKPDAAEPYYREVLERCRRLLGDDHEDTLISINNMGFLLKSQGRIAEAEPYFRSAVEGFRRVRGEEHVQTLSCIGNLGELMHQLGRHAEAYDLFSEAERAARDTLTGTDAKWLGNYLSKFGCVQTTLQNYPAGQTTLLEAHELLATGFGEDHERTVKCIEQLVKLYDAWHAAEPGQGYATKAAEWRAKLPSD